MYGVDKEYDGSVIVRIDNDGGTRVAGMPIGIRTKQISIVGGIGCKIIPTESASQTGGSAWHSTHGFYTQRTQDAASVPFTSVLQGCAEYGNIISTREYSCITADTSVHDTCQRVMNLSAENLSIRLLFSGGNVIQLRIAN